MNLKRRELANAIRFLSIDAVEKAKSGHPGMPMGMADIAQVLWSDYLIHNPNNPQWINRDRFVLSNGHGSMLLYSLLHLTGYNLSLEELKNFRQLNSKTPGHPEYDPEIGIETTTGPLGQGFGNAVGMAIAEELLASEFNRPGCEIINHHTYCFVGDGCLMEGVSHEVASLAGTLGLGKLIVFWDDNGISIDGEVKNWFLDDTPKRFEAYNWHVIKGVDGHDPQQIKEAIEKAKSENTKPTLICTRTTIGYGAPTKAGTETCHGSPLGAEEIKGVRKALNWKYDPFVVPKEIYAAWNKKESGIAVENNWNELFKKYKSQYPELAAEFMRRISSKIPDKLNELILNEINTINANVSSQLASEQSGVQSVRKSIATRKASQNVLHLLGSVLPEMFGGSADLTDSNLTKHKNSKEVFFSKNKDLKNNQLNGNYIHYGVREFGMATILNGLALHGGFIPYGGTFLVFCDYARNGVRLSALMKQRVVYVFTHDSIGLGEDGPTHQPIEHLTMLRVTPNVSLWRPCDEVETLAAWHSSINNLHGPTMLALTRQGVSTVARTAEQISNIYKGGYILYQTSQPSSAKSLSINLIATGSEVEIALDVAKLLEKDELNVQVVSMPSCDVFDQQDVTYKEKVIPTNVPTIAIEAGATEYWYKYVGKTGKIYGIDSFGKSAPYKEIYSEFGLSADKIYENLKSFLYTRHTSLCN